MSTPRFDHGTGAALAEMQDLVDETQTTMLALVGHRQEAEAKLAKAQEELKRLRDTLFVVRNTIGDLRNGFSKTVDPHGWVTSVQAFCDEALAASAQHKVILTRNAHEPKDAEVTED